MTDTKTRFEKAILSSDLANSIDPEKLLERGVDGEYRDLSVRAAWWSWKESESRFSQLAEAALFLLKAHHSDNAGATGAYQDGITWILGEAEKLKS